MRLTIENAKEYDGKKLYGKQVFHYWPLTVKQLSGKWYVVDRNSVMMPVPDSGDKFNAIYFEHAE